MITASYDCRTACYNFHTSTLVVLPPETFQYIPSEDKLSVVRLMEEQVCNRCRQDCLSKMSAAGRNTL